MRKHSLLKTMLLLCALIVGSSSAWADEEVYYTLDGTITTGGNSNYGEDGGGLTQNGISWSVTGNTTINPWRIGGKNLDKVNREVYSKTAMGDAITKVELVVGDINLTVNSIKLIVASNSTFTTVLQTIEKTSITANTTLTFNPSGSNWATGAFYKFVFNVTAGNSNKYIQLKSAKFYHEASGGSTKVSTPTFDPDPVGKTFTTAQNVEISCETEGASIYYTTNGDDPTNESTPYTSAISVTTSGTVLKAIAYKKDMDPSSVASATYTIKPTTPTITAAGATVTITGDAGCTFYYTTDDTAPTSASTKYTAPFNLTESCTIKAIAYDAYNNASDVKSYNFKYFPLNPKNINSGYFEKVTDVSTLENGDAILIVNETENVALSTTQNNNNRGQESVTISDNVIYAPGENVQKLVLVKQSEKINNEDTEETNVFYFYTGEEGYLYAPSSSSNHLKTEETPDKNNNARATISISEGDATIAFTGSSTHNLLKYNSGSSIFACYTGGQEAVQIYKEVAHNESATITSAEYATYCNATYALDFSGTGITAYTATDGKNSVKLNEITSGKVPAGTPVVLYKAGGGTVDVPVIASADAIEGTNDLRVSEGAAYSNAYVLAMNPTIGFYLWDSSVELNAGKIYLQAASSSRSFLGFEEGNTTSIDVRSKMEDVRGEVYNLNGQRVAQPTKGLYIVNGKKFVVK